MPKSDENQMWEDINEKWMVLRQCSEVALSTDTRAIRNWCSAGYIRGQRGEKTPFAKRAYSLADSVECATMSEMIGQGVRPIYAAQAAPFVLERLKDHLISSNAPQVVVNMGHVLLFAVDEHMARIDGVLMSPERIVKFLYGHPDKEVEYSLALTPFHKQFLQVDLLLGHVLSNYYRLKPETAKEAQT